MSEKILVPVLGESITEATVSKWLKNEGDHIEADEPIVELETDKVNLEVPSPVTGTLTKINSKDGSVVEVGGGAGGFILRQMFNNARACKLQIFDPQGQEIGLIDKPFRFIFSEMAAIGKNTQGMGEVGRVKRVSMITRNYTISVGGVNQFSIKSSLFQFGRFKFDITRNGIVVASIAKKYEGFMKMAFTQADNFSIQFFDKNLTLEERYSLFATLFLIDFDVFEQR